MLHNALVNTGEGIFNGLQLCTERVGGWEPRQAAQNYLVKGRVVIKDQSPGTSIHQIHADLRTQSKHLTSWGQGRRLSDG